MGLYAALIKCGVRSASHDCAIHVGITGFSISRLASTGAFGIAAIFAVCWAAAALGIVGSHAFIGLFTLAPSASVNALLIGGICAVITGAISYNLFGRRTAR